MLLYEAELVKVPLEEGELLLLVLRICGLNDGVVMLPEVVQLDLEFDDLKKGKTRCPRSAHERENTTTGRVAHLLASVLKISHQAPLRALEVGELHGDGLPCSLEVLRALLQILAPLHSGGRDGEGTLELLVDAFE